jgi:hypothetical protein
MHGHSSRTCRTPKHLTYLYQAFFKQNAVETNFIHKEDLEGYNAYLDVYDFFENPEIKQILCLVVESLGIISIFLYLY